MKVLFDEDIPARLKKRIRGHEIQTVYALGWNGQDDVTNVALAVQHGFQALVTCDRRLRRQVEQRLGKLKLYVLVLGREQQSNHIQTLREEIPRLQERLDRLAVRPTRAQRRKRAKAAAISQLPNPGNEIDERASNQLE